MTAPCESFVPGAAPRLRWRRASGSSPAWVSDTTRAETGSSADGQSTMTSRTMRGSTAATPGIAASLVTIESGARLTVTKICGKRVSA